MVNSFTLSFNTPSCNLLRTLTNFFAGPATVTTSVGLFGYGAYAKGKGAAHFGQCLTGDEHYE